MDGLIDGQEIALGTHPLNGDSLGDGLGDKAEADLHTDPLNPDSDGDGLEDGSEIAAGTNLLDSDTDDDGVPDGTDPTPTEAGVPVDFIEYRLGGLCTYLESLPLSELTDLKTPRPGASSKAQKWDLTAASAYLNTMSAGLTRNHAVESLVGSLAAENPQATAAWAATITEPILKQQVALILATLVHGIPGAFVLPDGRAGG